MPIDPAWNFAEATVAQGYDASATSIALSPGGAGARFPDPATFGAYNVSWWNKGTYPNPSDDPNREIVRVTAKNGDQLTIVRGQETANGGLAASTKNTGTIYAIAMAPTAKFRADILATTVDIGAQTIYVTEKGAVGDGVTDDTAAINAALAAGSLVYFPPGTYLVNGALLLHTNLRVVGFGMGTTTIKLKNAASATNAVFNGTNVDRVIIEGLTIDGNEVNNPSIGDAIRINGAGRVTLQELEIVNCRGNGISLGVDSGIIKYTTIQNCYIGKCHGSLIEIQNRGSANIGNLIQACHFESPAYLDATLKFGIDVRGAIRVSDCEFEGIHDNTIGILLQEDDATLGNGAHDSVVANCRIKGTGSVTNVSSGIVSQAKRVRVVNCFVEGTDRGFVSDAADGNDVSFLHSTAFNCADEGFRIAGDRNWLVHCHTEGAAVGIAIQATADNTTIRDSYVAGTTKVTNSGTNTHARGNRNWITESIVLTPTIDAGVTGPSSHSVPHLLDVTPLEEHCRLTIVQTAGEGTMPPTRTPTVRSADGTNVVIDAYVITAAAGVNFKVAIEVAALP